MSETFKVGFSSGFNSPYGILVENQYKGAILAVEETNREGGVLGREVVLVKRDDKMDPKRAEAVAEDLISTERVDLLAGSLSAATQINTNEIAKRHKIPFMSLSQSNDITTSRHLGPYTFHESITPYMTAQLIGRWGVENLGTRWMFVVPYYEWGEQVYASFRNILAKTGGQDLGVIKVPLGASVDDFKNNFPEILQKGPDALGVVNLGADQINFIRAAHETGLKREVAIVLGVADIVIADLLSPEELVGMYWGVNFYWGLENIIPSAARFVRSFRERFDGDLPTGYAGYAYAGVKELLRAANQAGEYPLNPDKLTAVLEASSYDHYKGPEWWRPCDHQSFQDFYIMRFKGPEEVKHKYDIGEILGTVRWDLSVERSCELLGHAGPARWGFAERGGV